MGCSGWGRRKQGSPSAGDSPLVPRQRSRPGERSPAGFAPSSEPGLREGAPAEARAFPRGLPSAQRLPGIPASLSARPDSARSLGRRFPAHLLPSVAGQLLLREEPHRRTPLGRARRLPGPGCEEPRGQGQDQGQRGQPPQPPPGRGACHGEPTESGLGRPGRRGPRARAPRGPGTPPRARPPGARRPRSREPGAGLRAFHALRGVLGRWDAEAGNLELGFWGLPTPDCALKVAPNSGVCYSSSLIRYRVDTANIPAPRKRDLQPRAPTLLIHFYFWLILFSSQLCLNFESPKDFCRG